MILNIVSQKYKSANIDFTCIYDAVLSQLFCTETLKFMAMKFIVDKSFWSFCCQKVYLPFPVLLSPSLKENILLYHCRWILICLLSNFYIFIPIWLHLAILIIPYWYLHFKSYTMTWQRRFLVTCWTWTNQLSNLYHKNDSIKLSMLRVFVLQ